jgi:hypothetical protein
MVASTASPFDNKQQPVKLPNENTDSSPEMTEANDTAPHNESPGFRNVVNIESSLENST